MSHANKYIFDLLSECSYIPAFKDYIIKILIEFSTHKGVSFFKTSHKASFKRIIGINYPMTIKLKGHPYEVKLIIYIVPEFPEKAPEIYINNNGNPFLAANPKNHDVNPENFRMMSNKLFNWVRSISLQEILSEISISFEQHFPIYMKTGERVQPQVKKIHHNQFYNANMNFSSHNDYRDSETNFIDEKVRSYE